MTLTRGRRTAVAGSVLATILLGGMVGTPIAHAIPQGAAVCMTLSSYPTFGGVMGVAEALMEEGYSPYQTGEIIGEAVRDYCPEHTALILRFAAAFN